VVGAIEAFFIIMEKPVTRGLHGELSNYNAKPQAARNRSMKKVRFLRFDVHAEAIALP